MKRLKVQRTGPDQMRIRVTCLLLKTMLICVNSLKHCLKKATQSTLPWTVRMDLEKARGLLPDIIVTDVMMPVMDGYQMTKLIKEDNSLKRIPVLMLTAKAEIAHKIEGLEYGADDYLTKPFNSKELLTRISSLLRTSEYQKALTERNKELNEARGRITQMAEVATGVLHNIGNILNSVNISGDEMTSVLKNSRLEGLVLANEMLKENIDDIENFLVNDEKGRVLPEYFIKVSGLLKEEHDKLEEELASQVKHIGLMKDIISTQQSIREGSSLSPGSLAWQILLKMPLQYRKVPC